MALQITDLVSKEALNQLSRLNTELEKVKATYESVAKDLAINVNVKVEGREDLANLTKVITTNFNALNNATKKAEEEQNKFSAAVGQEVKTIKEAQQYNKKLREERNKTNVTTKDGKKHVEELNKQIDKNTSFVKKNTDAYTKQKMGIGGYFQSMMKGLTVFELLRKGVDFIRESIKKALETIKQFESANARLAAITGESAKGMRELEAQARQLGKTTRYTATEITQLQTELAKLGFKKDDIIAMTDAVYKFGLATGGSMADSAALAGAMLRTFGAQADETKRYVSALTAATTKSALSFGYLQVALPIVSGGAAMMGWSIEDVTALLGKLADSGMSASIAATALRNIFLKLSDTNSEMYAKFGKVENFDQFIVKLKELQESGIDLGNALELADKRSVIPFANLIKHADEATKLRDSITGVGDELDAMAAKISDTVEGSTYALKSAWEALGLAFYNSKGWIKDCIDGLTDIIRTAAEAMTSIDALRKQWYSEYSMSEEDRWTNPYSKIVKGEDGKVKTEVTSLRQEAINRAQERYNKLIADGLTKEKARNKVIEETNALYRKQMEDRWAIEKDFDAKYKKEIKDIDSNWGQYLWTPALMKNLGEKSALKDMIQKNKQQTDAMVNSIQKTIDAIEAWDFDNIEPKKTYTGVVDPEKAKEQAQKLQRELDKLEEMSAKARIAVTEETEEKKSLTIIAKYEKMIAEINRMELVSQTKRNAVIAELRMAMNAELLKNEEDFSSKRAQIDARNWAAAYGKNRKNAQNAEQTLLDANRAKELREAEQMGYDKEAIMEKYWALQFELNNKYRAYDIAMEKTNIKNKLEYIQLGTEEEFALRKKLLDLEYEEELKNAEKTGADMEAIRKKYANKIATAEINQKNNRLSEATTRIDTEQSNVQSDLMEAFRKGEMDETTYNLRSEQNARKYAVARLQATIDTMEEELKIAEKTGADMEAELYNKIAKAREELNKTLLDSDKATFKAMIENVEKWASAAQEAFSAIAGFMSQNYEIEIDQLDDEKDKLDEKYDADVERIERMEEQGAISSEDAEARKRAAKDQTEQKQKEISKKQQELAYKQAVWDKAASASQTAISTALGIMKVWAAEGTNASKVVMSALVAAQGAMQLATILATPIPKYAKGTEGHKGGLAVVGDGGRSEFVVMGAQGWVTPSTSTLVDLPKGAQVFPDAKSVMMTLPVYNENGKQVKVVNDYKELERKQKTANGLLKVIAANTRGNSNYNQYKRTIW